MATALSREQSLQPCVLAHTEGLERDAAQDADRSQASEMEPRVSYMNCFDFSGKSSALGSGGWQS